MKSEKKKILYVTFEYGKIVLGGVGRIINGVTKSISETHDVDVLLFEWSQRKKDFKFKLFKVRHGRITSRKLSGNFKESLAKRLKSQKYANIHIMHTGAAFKDCIEVIQRDSPESQLIYSCNSLLKYEENIRSNYDSSLNTEKFIFESADVIHLNNQTALEYLKVSYPEIVESKQISIIANGVSDERFKKIDRKFLRRLKKDVKPECNKIVLCMSRWSHGKGLEQLLEAVPAVARKYPDIKFVVAGRKKTSWEKGSEEYVKGIDEKIARLNKNVYSLGWLNDAQRNAVYSITDVYVMPSHIEYFPYSILEPMIGKLPIVSSNISCVEEMLVEGEECLMYRPMDSLELSDKILELLERKDLQERFVANCYDKVTKIYSWDRISNDYLKMYSMNTRKTLKQPENEILYTV